MAIADACLQVLNNYILNPWQWPRESDVVCHLVTDTKTRLKQPDAEVQIASHAKVPSASIPRVRTEIKIKGASPWKIDVCVQTPGTNDVYVGGGGTRDVVLTVSPHQIEEILEVKMYPGLLMPSRNGCNSAAWIDDLVKLHLIKSCLMKPDFSPHSFHALFIDTSLNIHSVINGLKPQKLDASKTRRPNNLHCFWPLHAGKKYEIKDYLYPGETKSKQKQGLWDIELHPLTSLPPANQIGSRIYLWAVGLTGNSLPTPANRLQVIPAGQAVPACWEVGINKGGCINDGF